MGKGADSEVTFGVDIEETGGEDAASQLEKLRAKIQEDTAALRELQAAMRNLKGGTSVNIDAFKSLKQQIDAKKTSLAQAQAKVVNLGGALGDMGKKSGDAAKESGANMEALGQSVKGALGPMGGMIERVQALTKGLGKAGMAGVIAIVVVAIVVLIGALIAGAVAFAKFAVASADASRNQRIAIEELGLSAAEAKKLQGSMDALRRATGVSVDDQIKDFKQLKDAQVDTSEAARKAIALARAGGGDEAVKKLVQDLKNGKSAAQALADAQAKYGKVVAEKMLRLDDQIANFHADIADLFKDVAVEPFLKAVHELLSLFSQNTATGRALHTIITAIGNKLLSWATAAIPYIIAGFKQVLIWGLKVYIAVAKFLKSDTGQTFITVLKVIGVVLGVLVAASAIAMAMFTAMFMIPLAGIALLIGGISQLITWFGELWDGISGGVSGALSAVYNFASEFVSAGANMVLGLAQGILSSGSAVLDAISNVAGGAIKWAMHILGIGSPSKVFAKIGHFTAQGMAKGMDAGGDAVEGAARGMAGAAVAGGTSGASGASSSTSNSSSNVTVNITVNASGGDGEGIAAAVKREVEAFFDDQAYMAAVA